jgi:hypothetical protein
MTPSLRRLPRALRQVCLAYIVAWTISPPLAFGDAWRVLALCCAAVWVLLEFGRHRNIFRYPTLPVVVAVLYVTYTLAIEALVPDMGTLSRHYQVWIMFFFLLVFESERRHGGGAYKPLFWLSLMLLPFWMWSTINAYGTVDADVSRIITRSSVEAEELTAQGIGGFGLVYSVVMAIPILAGFVLRPGRLDWRRLPGGRWRKRFAWVLMLVNLLLAIWMVLNAGYSFALLLMTGSLLLVFLVNRRGLVPVIRGLFFATIATVVILLAFGPFVGTLSNLARGTEYQQKLVDLQESFQSESAVGTVGLRMERYERSLKLFYQNPVLGVLKIDDVGKHSAYLDRFAQYGFFFGAMFVYLILYLPLRIVRKKAADPGISFSVLFVAAAFPLINNVFAAFGFMIFIFYPAALALTSADIARAPPGRAGPRPPAHAQFEPGR